MRHAPCTVNHIHHAPWRQRAACIAEEAPGTVFPLKHMLRIAPKHAMHHAPRGASSESHMLRIAPKHAMPSWCVVPCRRTKPLHSPAP